MEKINNIIENLSNGIYWVLIGIIVALIIDTAALFLYSFFVKKKNEHKHVTAVKNAFATWMTGGLLSLIAIVFVAPNQSGISVKFVELYFVVFFFSSLIAAFKMFGTKTKNSDSNNLKIDITTFVDLGLPSGTLWANMNVKNENGDDIYISIDQATKKFGKKLPTLKKWKELFKYCTCKWNEERKGIDIIGPNGKSIFLPGRHDNGASGIYWTSSIFSKGNAYYVSFDKNQIFIGKSYVFGSAYGLSVRLCKNKNTEKPRKVQTDFNID